MARQVPIGLLFLVSLVTAAWGEDREVLRRSFLGKGAPELVSEKGHWLGQAPRMTLSELKGKVVWL